MAHWLMGMLVALLTTASAPAFAPAPSVDPLAARPLYVDPAGPAATATPRDAAAAPWAGSSMPSLPGGFGLSSGSGGVTVFALRLRDHLQLTATFDETTARSSAVHAALAAMADPVSLLTAAVPA